MEKVKAAARLKIESRLGYGIYELGLLAALVSFLGFAVENIWLLVTKGYINNRNMNLPFLIGYGAAVLLIYYLMGTPDELRFFQKYEYEAEEWKRTLVYFLGTMVFVSLGEILIGTMTERFCGIEYWNYQTLPLHITKYTSIPTSIGFSAAITLFMKKVFYPLMKWIRRQDPKLVKTGACILVGLMLADYLISYGRMILMQGFNEKWRVRIVSGIFHSAAVRSSRSIFIS